MCKIVYNFEELITAYSLCIPKIQREYVQGQNAKGKIFIKNIMETLTKTDKCMYLDLVYGATKEKIFEPIDGQQRLTTLFLLYWYVCQIEEIDNPLKGDLQKKLQKFSYETRDSSRDFCQFLTTSIELNMDDIPSEVIKNHGEYRIVYDSDYTIGSMLSMLDLIHDNYQLYCKNQDLYNKLKRILFIHHELKGYKLSGELYTIMNDRGKSLTNYENLKSALDGWMKESTYKNESDVLVFLKRIDSVWSENIWKYLAGENDDTADKIFFRVITRYFGCYLLCNKDNFENVDYSELRDEACNTIKELYDYFNQLEEFDDFSKFKFVLTCAIKSEEDFCNFFKNMYNYFELLFGDNTYKDRGINKDLNDFGTAPWKMQQKSQGGKTVSADGTIDSVVTTDNTKNLIEIIKSESFTNPDAIVCIALQYYAKDFDGDISSPDSLKELKDWKRLVWNVLEVSDAVASFENTQRVIKELTKCVKYIHHNLYRNLPNIESNLDAMKYEVKKAKWIALAPDFKDKFESAEKHQYLKGDIDWLVGKYPEKVDKKTIEQEMAAYDKRTSNLEKVFNEEGLEKDKYIALLSEFLTLSDSELAEYFKNKTIHLSNKEGKEHSPLKTLLHSKYWNDNLRKLLEASDFKELDKHIADNEAKITNEKIKVIHQNLCGECIGNESNKYVLDWLNSIFDITGKRPILKIENILKNENTKLMLAFNKFQANGHTIWMDEDAKTLHQIVKALDDYLADEAVSESRFNVSTNSTNSTEEKYWYYLTSSKYEIKCKDDNDKEVILLVGKTEISINTNKNSNVKIKINDIKNENGQVDKNLLIDKLKEKNIKLAR